MLRKTIDICRHMYRHMCTAITAQRKATYRKQGEHKNTVVLYVYISWAVYHVYAFDKGPPPPSRTSLGLQLCYLNKFSARPGAAALWSYPIFDVILFV